MHALSLQLPQRDLEGQRETTARLPVLSALGFLVTSASFRLLSANQEAITILTYPDRQTPPAISEAFEKKIRLGLLRARSSQVGANQCSPAFQFESGRRTYFCRPFVLRNRGKASSAATVLIVLERGICASCALSQISQQFHLTQREQEVVTLLLQGLGNKEMAERLGVSINTVKSYLRLVMIKMGVCGRSGIVSRVLSLVLSTHHPEPD